MPRIDLKVSVTFSESASSSLELHLYARYGVLRELLPRTLEVSGQLVPGTLVLIDEGEKSPHRHPHGRGITLRTISHVFHDPARPSAETGLDYINLPLDHLGHDVTEPVAPVELGAEAEPGLVVLDALAPWHLVPRRVARDPRVVRVLEHLARFGGDPSRLVARLPPRDRAELERLDLDPRRSVAPHVHLIFLARGRSRG